MRSRKRPQRKNLNENIGTMFKNGMRPVHPGEILREDYLVPLGMTANALAKALKCARGAHS